MSAAHPAHLRVMSQRDRQKSDLTAGIELAEHRLKMKAEAEAAGAKDEEEQSLFASNDGVLVAVATTQVDPTQRAQSPLTAPCPCIPQAATVEQHAKAMAELDEERKQAPLHRQSWGVP